ncbi:hypothetical protein B0H66DRAFT_596551 [Apodospora peruviana]|uniref:Cytochrome c oxidase assembly factor 3 n=1 Tax=Apodospora peruviana TaxID=516989 RepID=A0AAE0IPQ2_9PEZI|nr:hypothetical protein B0H66DRAFT_596551 [Apodospora peruviana]
MRDAMNTSSEGLKRQATYYDRSHAQSASLIRARRPFLVKNMIVGACCAAFVVGVYTYTVNVVGQDEFEDVKVPDTPVTKQLQQSPASSSK